MKQKLKDIKAVLDSLTEEQLEQSAFLMGVDEPGFHIAIEINSDPLLQTDEGLCPPWPDMTEEEKEEYPEVYPAGSVFFYKASEVSPVVAYEVRPIEGGFKVYDIKNDIPITDICPEDVANEICRDFNNMRNGDFSALEFKLEIGKCYEVAEPRYASANGHPTIHKIEEMRIDPNTGEKRFRSDDDWWFGEDGYYSSPGDQETADFYCLVREVESRV